MTLSPGQLTSESIGHTYKQQGNEWFRNRKFNDAITAYTRGVLDCQKSDSPLLSVLLSNRSAAFLELGAYQKARRDALDAMELDPDNFKARYRLSKALFHLRSYEKSLQELGPLQNSADPSIQSLLRQLIYLVAEYRSGEYDIPQIDCEVQKNSRVCHADYCSKLIEIRKSALGGCNRRGVFAKQDIPGGTLIVASKAIASVFHDETGQARKRDIHPDLWPLSYVTVPYRVSDICLANAVYNMITENDCGRVILNLEGGINQGKLDIDLSTEDVYDESVDLNGWTVRNILDIVLRNAYSTIGKSDIEGNVLHYVPSFFNHSCMPNTDRSEFGDMIFIRTSVNIPAGSEIFTTYVSMLEGESLDERTEVLRRRTGSFVCNCGLCQFEKSHPEIANSAIEIVKEMSEKHCSPTPASPNAVQDLQTARLQLYKLFQYPPPEPDLITIQAFESQDPRQFALGRLIKKILWILGAKLLDQFDKAVYYLAEAFAITKGNPLLAQGSIFEAHMPALLIWQYHRCSRDPNVSGPIASYWMNEMKEICLRVGGKKFFGSEKNIVKFIKNVEAKVASIN